MTLIKSTEIIQDDILKNARKEAEATIIVFEKLEQTFKDLLETSTDFAKSLEKSGSKNLEDIAKAIDKANNASEAYNETREEKIKLQKQIAELEIKEQKAAQQAIKTQKDKLTLEQKEIQLQKQKKANVVLTDEQIKQNELLKKQTKTRAEQLKALAVIEDKESGILDKLAANNKLLRLERAKLTDETKDGRKEIKRINKEIDKNTDRIKENVDEFQKDKIAVGGYTKALNQAIKKVGAFSIGLLGVNSALGAVGNSLSANEESSEELEVLTDQLSSTFDVLKNATGTAALSLFEYTKNLFNAGDEGKTFSETLDDVAKAYDNIGNKINKSNKVREEATKQNIAFRKESRGLREEIERLQGVFDKQNIIAGDDTKSFNEQETAAIKAAEAAILKASVENDLSTAQISIVNKQIAALSNLTEQEVANSSAIELSGKSTANINSLLDQRTELNIQLIQTQNELTNATLNNDVIIKKVQRDRFERELDFAKDIFEAQFTVNERRINNDELTLEQQAIIAEKNAELTEKSFKNQIELIESFLGQKTDIEELALEQDEEIIRERLRQLAIDDVTYGRILEVVKDRRTAVQDQVELEKDLTDKVKERAKTELQAEQALSEFKKSVEVTKAEEEFDEKKTKEALDKLEKLKIEAAILSRDNELAVVEDNADKRVQIIEEAEEEIRKIKKESAEDQNEIDKKALQEREELTKTAFKVLSDVVTQNSEKRVESIDKEITATQGRISEIQASAEAGSLARQDSLAFEQKKQAELELQREKQIQKQKQVELGLLALEVYASKVAAGDKNPLASTAVDISVLQAFAASIPTFFEGTKGSTVADVLGSPDIPNTKDGYIIRADGSETILNPHETRDYQSYLKSIDVRDRSSVNNIVHSDTETHKKLDKLTNVIESQPHYVGADFNELTKVFTQTIESKNKLIRKHSKVGGLFS